MHLKQHLPPFKKIAYIFGAVILSILVAMSILPYFYKDEINSALKNVINKNINGEVHYDDVNISFFKHFPLLTTSIVNAKIKGSMPFEDKTLVKAKEISLGIDLFSLFGSKILLDKFIISEAEVNILVDSNGNANYNIYQAEPTSEKTDNSASSSSLALRLIKLEKVNLHYHDASIPMEITAKNFNYEGRGDLSSDVFDLETDAKIEALTFSFDKENYVENKSIDAQLITQINTKNLSFVFEKNDIKINKLPVRFKGALAFLSNGYHLDFKLKSQESTLAELLSLVPSNYAEWLKNTKVRGTSEVFMNLEGDYIVEENKMPNLSLGLIINDGFLAYNNAKVPLSNWNAKLRVDLPQLNIDSLNLDLKQFQFNIAEGFFKTAGNIKGFDPLTIHSSVNSSIDLGSLSQAIQWPDLTFSGKLDLEGKIDGTYATDTLTYGIRNHKKVYVSSIPKFHIKNTLKDGYFKFSKLPAAIEKVAFHLEASSQDGQLKNAQISLKQLDIKSLNNFIKGQAEIKNFENIHVDANVQAEVNLADIKKVYPLDSVDIAGNVFANIITQGALNLAKRKIPETSATITMKNGYFKNWSYPVPLEQINIETHVNSKTASLKDLSVKILPISFKIAGESFFLNADFQNFDNIKYAIKSRGKLNLEPIYKIFALEGLNVKGSIRTDLDLAGLQSDATQGKYNRLKNNGNIEIVDIQVRTDLLPQPIEIKSGKFTFHQEKLNFDQLITQYTSNEINIKGFVNNIVNYLTGSSDVLKGNFDLYSKKINIDDFMAFANNQESSSENTASNSGVIMLPQNLDIQVKGIVDQVRYDQILLKGFKGHLELKSGNLEIKDTGFELAGLKTKMHIKYQPLHANKAKFNFVVQADSFDIQRAYREIPLFQEMVTSAKNAYGLVSMDYELGGFLNKEMMPIMPTLNGKGTLTLDQIKFKNFKLLNSISKTTSKEGFLNSDVKKVKIKTSIRNNVMTIDRTKMKMAGFRPRFEGQVTLDGRMNIGFRLGLPPFGIFGIPMKINGTSDNFKIKLGKYKDEDLDTEMDDEDKAAYDQTVSQDSTKNIS